MKFELPLKLSTLVLLAPLALAPLGCDSGDEGDDEAADNTDDNTDMDATDTADDGPDPAAGQAIHDASCTLSGCHSAADMVQLSERVPMLDDAGLTDRIRLGGAPDGGTMPAFNENAISAAQLEDLIAFLRQMYG